MKIERNLIPGLHHRVDILSTKRTDTPTPAVPRSIRSTPPLAAQVDAQRPHATPLTPSRRPHTTPVLHVPQQQHQTQKTFPHNPILAQSSTSA